MVRRGYGRDGWQGGGLALETLDHDETLDVAAQKRVEKRSIIAEDHATIRLAVSAVHVGMGEDAVAAEHLTLVQWNETKGLHAVEQRPTRHEVIDVGRRRSPISDIHIARVVEPLAKSRVRFELVAVGQIDGVGGDVIDRRTFRRRRNRGWRLGRLVSIEGRGRQGEARELFRAETQDE